MKTAVDRIVAGADFTHLATFKSYVTGATVVDDTHVQVTTNKPYATLVSDMPAPISTDYYNEGRRRRVPQAADRRRCLEVRLADAELGRQVRALRRLLGCVPQAELQEAHVPDRARRVEPRGRRQDRRPRHRVRPHRRRGDAVRGRRRRSRSSRPRAPASPTCMAIDNVFPDEESPLKNLDVRKALTMAVDREGIAKSLYGGYAEVANSPIPSVMLGYDPDAKPLPYDPDGAKDLLAEAGNSRPVADPQLVQRDVDDPRRPEAGRDRRLAVAGDRHQRHAEPRRLGHDPPGVAGQAAARRRDHRRAGVLLLRAGAPHAVVLLDDRRLHDGQRPGARRPLRRHQPGDRQGQAHRARRPARRPC